MSSEVLPDDSLAEANPKSDARAPSSNAQFLVPKGIEVGQDKAAAFYIFRNEGETGLAKMFCFCMHMHKNTTRCAPQTCL